MGMLLQTSSGATSQENFCSVKEDCAPTIKHQNDGLSKVSVDMNTTQCA
jgi:hypothetical protein